MKPACPVTHHPDNCGCQFRPDLRGDEDENRQWVLRVSDALGMLADESTGYRTPSAEDAVAEAYRLRLNLHRGWQEIAGLHSHIGQLEIALHGDPYYSEPLDTEVPVSVEEAEAAMAYALEGELDGDKTAMMLGLVPDTRSPSERCQFGDSEVGQCIANEGHLSPHFFEDQDETIRKRRAEQAQGTTK